MNIENISKSISTKVRLTPLFFLILFYHIRGLQQFWSSDLNNLMNNPSNSPVISEKKMFR